MREIKDKVTFKGNPVTIVGEEVKFYSVGK